MRVLTNLEMNEFELTYKFLDHNIGSFAQQAPTVSSLRFDDRLPSPEIMDFVRRMGNLKEFPEFNFDAASFARLSPLRKINLIFNNVSPARRKIAIQKLIAYCFKYKVQPHKLRMKYDKFNIVFNETPTVVEYEVA